MVAAMLVVRRSRSPCRGLYTNEERAATWRLGRAVSWPTCASYRPSWAGPGCAEANAVSGPGANRLVVDAIATAALPG